MFNLFESCFKYLKHFLSLWQVLCMHKSYKPRWIYVPSFQRKKLFIVQFCFYHFEKQPKMKKWTLVYLYKTHISLCVFTLASEDFQNALWTISYVATVWIPQSHQSWTLQSSEEKMETCPKIQFLGSFDIGLSLGEIHRSCTGTTYTDLSLG